MNRKILTILLAAVLTLGLASCGGDSEETKAEDSVTEETAAENGDYTFENGVFTNATFSMTVPDGWTIDDSYVTAERIKFIHAEDSDSYDVFSNGSFEIQISDFAVGQDRLNELVANDEQFFEEGFQVEDIAVGAYSGVNTIGESKSYKDCSIQIAEIECWHEGTNDVSRGQISIAYYNEDEYADVMDMLASVTPLTDTENAAAAPESSETSTVDLSGYVTIELPAGWNIEEQRDVSVKLTNSRFSSGYINIYVCTFNDKTAQQWAEAKSGNFGGGMAIENREMCGKTFTGFRVNESQDLFATVLDDGVSVELSTMFFNLDQVQDLLDAMTIQ